jgi:hydroxyethylthiazole kinase-like uncharacterized protein yjeF
MARPEDRDGVDTGNPARPGEDDSWRSEPPLAGASTWVLSRRAGRELDRAASTELGIPSIVLMENAAIGIAAAARGLVRDVDRPGAIVLCGRGNNGGDGLAVARHLRIAGWRIGIVLAAPPSAYAGDAAVNLLICQRSGLPVHEATEADPNAAVDRAIERLGPPDLLVDALLGTGATGAVRGPVAGLIHAINQRRGGDLRVLAVDLPSGMDADTGEPLGVSDGAEPAIVRADLTVTMVGLKPGFLSLAAQEFLGDITVVGIGVPPELVARFGTPLAAASFPGRLRDPEADESPPSRDGRGA